MERKQFNDILEAVNHIVSHMATTAELREINDRLSALESKVTGINRRLDNEAMERLDTKSLFERLAKLETAVFDEAGATFRD